MQKESEQEIRRVLQAAFGTIHLHGKLPPSDHCARLEVAALPEAWVLIYGDYMDFSYTEKTPPDVLIDEVLTPLKPAQIIDWSPGRLACVQYKQADAVSLAKAIDALLKELYGLTDYKFVGSLETWGRA